jgi:DNA-binding transcriptional ArsR family regulator
MVAESCNIVAMAKNETARSEAGIEAESQAELGARVREGAEAEKALPLGPQPLPELIERRHIHDAPTMKALADPLRIKIMGALSKHVYVEPRIMTVKQIAEELGEPATKLYRHIKQLLAVELIQVAELRLVGGIVEQRYRVAQKSLSLAPERADFRRETLMSEEMYGFVSAVIDEFFVNYEQAVRSGRAHVLAQDCLDNPPHVRSVGVIADTHIPQSKAAEFGERFHALVKEFTAEPNQEVEDAVNANLLVMYYATELEG